jgi:hypothetical protein
MIMHDERRISDLLHAVEVPPSRVDVHRAMADGRVRRRRRAWLTSGGAAAAFAVFAGAALQVTGPGTGTGPPAALPVAGCRVEPLALPTAPGGGTVQVAAIDPTGRFVVGVQDIGQRTSRVILWTDGVPAFLYAPDHSAPVGVNGSGTVIGLSRAVGSWVYRNGASIPITAPGTSQVSVHAINERGDIAGMVFGEAAAASPSGPAGPSASATAGGAKTAATAPPAGSNVKEAYAAVWPAQQPHRPRKLEAPGPATVNDIGDDGTVVGAVGRLVEPYLWTPDGTGRALRRPAGVGESQAVRVAGGWAVGFAVEKAPAVPGANDEKPTLTTTPLRWRLDTGAVDQLPGNGLPAGLTPGGVVIFGDGTGPGTIFDGKQLRALPHPDGLDQINLVGISDDGRLIAGNAHDGKGASAPYLWRC